MTLLPVVHICAMLLRCAPCSVGQYLLAWRNTRARQRRSRVLYRGSPSLGHDVARLRECERVRGEEEESAGVHHSAPSQLFTQISSAKEKPLIHS
jgi:hypothetical protein